MIRVILRGRTGNILFQYAFGRYLAAKHGVPLVLDASWYNRRGWIEVSHLLKKPLKAKVVRRFPLAARAWRKLSGKHYWQMPGIPLLCEPPEDHSFREEFLDAPANVVLHGYFQTPLYFNSMADEIRQEIRSLISTSHDRHDLPAPNSVAIHIRRGDFVRIPAFNVCDETYYRESIDLMRSRVGDARFFIFSDDPEWCSRNFRESDCQIMSSADRQSDPLLDLDTMSRASHHIISNSSYSWWAAWLASHPHQQVIMPDRWFAGEIIAPMKEKRWDRTEKQD